MDAACTPAYLDPHICAETEEEETRPVNMDCNTGVLNLVDPVSPTRIVLVPPAGPNQSAEAAYDTDDITVVRIVGHILMMPVWTLTETALAGINAAPAGLRDLLRAQYTVQRHYFLRAGMRKETMILDPVTREYVWPRRDPLDSIEWVDGRYVRQWEYETMPGQLGTTQVNILEAGSVMGCCSNVTGTGGGGGSATNILTDGSGTINTEIDDIDISTECEPCVIDPANFRSELTIMMAPTRPIRMPVSSRKRFRIRENEGLQIVINYTTVDYTSNAQAAACYPDIRHGLGVGFLAMPHIKLLIES